MNRTDFFAIIGAALAPIAGWMTVLPVFPEVAQPAMQNASIDSLTRLTLVTAAYGIPTALSSILGGALGLRADEGLWKRGC